MADSLRPASSRRSYWLALSTFGIFGFLFGVWLVVLPDLQQALNLSAGSLGTALTVGTLASFPVMIGGGRLADRLGTRILVAGSGLLTALALAAFAWVDGYPAFLVVLLAFFGVSGAYDVGINAAAVGLEHERAQRLMAYFHAAFSGGGAVAAVLTGVLLHIGMPFRLLYLITAALVAVVAAVVWGNPELVSSTEDGRTDPFGEKHTRNLYRSPALLLLAVVAGVVFFAEGTLETWTAIYLRSALALPPVLGAAGPAVFYTAMLIGRLGSAGAIERFGRRTLLQLAGAVTAVGMGLALATTEPPVVLAGILFSGLALAGVAPAAFSLAGDQAPDRKGEAIAVITTVGYSGFLVGPALIGGLADHFGLRVALGTIIVSGLVVAALGWRMGRPEGATEDGG